MSDTAKEPYRIIREVVERETRRARACSRAGMPFQVKRNGPGKSVSATVAVQVLESLVTTMRRELGR